MITHQATIEIPETVLLAEKTDVRSFVHEMRVLAAIKMYEMGRLTSGRAAELAGMSRIEFLLGLRQYHVFPLSTELDELESAYA